MQIITVSRGSQSYGENFAKMLAAKLGYLCIGREEILEEATRQRIPIGKIETAIIKPYIYSEELALELEHYKALATSILCEKSLNNNIVYHGRTGHLLLPGIDHILKIRVIADMESRIEQVMQKLLLSRQKAKQYIEQLEIDRKRWVKKFYNVDWDISTLYDFVLNLSHMNVENAATAVCSMAQLPEFQATPANIKSLHDLHLAAKARLLLIREKATSHMNIKIRASEGILYVTYLPQQVKEAERISEILSRLKEAREIICTEAETNILWVQESFNPEESAYQDVLKLANTWGAAVELVQITPSDSIEEYMPAEDGAKPLTEDWRESGILEDKKTAEDRSGISKIYEKLINDGSAGGKRNIQGSQKTLLNAIDRTIPYRLIIMDNIFREKGHAAQVRLLREWSNFIEDHIKIPVLTLGELRSKYRFGFREVIRMVLFGVLTAIVLLLVYLNESDVIGLLTIEGTGYKILVTIGVFAFVPLFAFTYSSFIKLLLKMIKFE